MPKRNSEVCPHLLHMCEIFKTKTEKNAMLKMKHGYRSTRFYYQRIFITNIGTFKVLQIVKSVAFYWMLDVIWTASY